MKDIYLEIASNLQVKFDNFLFSRHDNILLFIYLFSDGDIN